METILDDPQLKNDKENVIHLHNEVPLSGKNNDILKFEYKQMELNKTILSDVTPTQKDEYGLCASISGY